MHTNKFYITFLLLLPVFAYGANPPGYLGKKTLIGAYICYMPDYLSALQEDEPKDFQFNTRSIFSPGLVYNFQLSRIVSNNIDVSLQVGFLRYGIDEFQSGNMIMTKLVNGNEAKFSRAKSMNYKLIARFNQYFQSPLGYYNGAGLSLLNQNLEIVDDYGNSDDLTKVSDIGICYETGIRRHIGGNLILDLGLEFNFYINGFLNNKEEYSRDFEEYTLERNKKIYARRNLANFKLGLNYLF